MITQISASAGSGKTYTLTRLFLELLRGALPEPAASGCAVHGRNLGYSLPEILAATFTNKAAAEMKDRVISSLKELALEELREKGAGAPGRAEGFAGLWVERILRHYGALNIRTIDSLLTALVRLSALELELPPDFEPSFEAGEFFTPFYDGLMEDLSAGGLLMEVVTGHAGGYGGGGDFWADYTGEVRGAESAGAEQSVGELRDGLGDDPALFLTADAAGLRADLVRACRSLLFFGNGSGFTPKRRLHDQVFELTRRLLTGRAVPRMDADAILARLAILRNTLVTAAGELRARLAQERLSVNANVLKVIEACAGLRGHDAPPSGKSAHKRTLDECLNAASKGCAPQAAHQAYGKFRSALDEYASALPLFKQALQLAPLSGLALEIHARMLAGRFEGKLLPALSIPFLAGQALSGEYGVSDALCRLGTRLSRLLLDEFQDTSREQWAAILPLVEESLSTGGGLTYVGDVKQAIYGWRGGDARLFDQVMDEPRLAKMRPRRQSRGLPFNWRSHPAIVAHNNAFFSQLRDPDLSERVLAAMLPNDTPGEFVGLAAAEARRVFDQVEQAVPPEKRWESDPKGRHALARHYIVQAGKTDEVRELVRVRLRALFLDELLPVWNCGDIAVLTRSGEEGALVAQWLAEWGLPVVTENSFLLAAHPLIGRLVSFLAFLDYPPDDLAFWESVDDPRVFWPECDLTAARLTDWLARVCLEYPRDRPPLHQLFRAAFPDMWNSRIAPFHSGAGLMSAYDTLRETIRRFSLLERLPDHAPFLLRLLEIAHLAETRGHSSLAAFLAFWRSCKDSEQLPLPEGMNAVRVMTIHKAKGLEFPVVVLPFQHQAKARDPELVPFRRHGLDLLARAGKELPERHHQARITDELERLNLLYVAWTRPVYALHSFITRPRSASTPLQRALEVLLSAHLESGVCECEWLGAAEGKGGPLDAAIGQKPHGNCLQIADFGPRARKAGLFAQGVDSDGPRPEQKGPLDAAIGQKPHLEWRPMDWLPRLNIYRSTLEDSRLTPARRGILAHLCLEHLILSDPANAAQRLKDARRAVRQGMRLFPLPVDDPEAVAGEMEACLAWFAALPQAPLWLAHGLREQGVIDARGNMHRVDLLVDEALYHSGDAAARPETALVNGETTDLPPRSAFLHAIDYKTGRAASDEVREEHRRQVRRYMRLASQARGRPARGTLVYLDERRIEEVQP